MTKLSEARPPHFGLTESAAPATPAAGEFEIYAATDGTLHTLNDSGSDVELGAGGSLSRTEYVMASDTTMTTANTEYSAASGTPAAGTYQVWGILHIKTGSASTNLITTMVGRIKKDSAVIDERQVVHYVGNDFGYPIVIPLMVEVTTTGVETIELAAVCDRAGAVMAENPFSNSSAVGRGCVLALVKVA